jgi:hypothetical protein
MVEEQTVVLTANEPQNHFLRAQQLLSQKDTKAAAGELRMAAAYMDMQASRGRGGQDDAQLKQSADRLRQEARQIAQQSQNGANESQLKQAFGQANYALADHLQALADKEVRNQKSVMAGHDLAGAADSLAAAYAWSGQQPPTQVSSAIQESQRLATQLLAPEDAAQSSGNSSNADRAQTAAARQGEQQQQQQAPPANASQAIDQFGQAIRQAKATFESQPSANGRNSQSQQKNQSP